MTRKKLATVLAIALLPLAIGAFVLQGQVRSANGPRLFAQVLRYIEEHAVDSLSQAEIYEKAARGLVRNLNDPYAELYSPEQLASFQRNTLGNNYGGIGMQIESQDGLITVTTVFSGTPGEHGGVQAGDRIMVVDTTRVTGMPLDAVSRRLTGPPGTTVNVTFAREGVSEPIRVTFTRAVIQVPAVPYTLVLEGNVGYVPLVRFNESSADQLEKAIRDLRRRNVGAYVLDMRRNPGGSLDQALEISNLFLQPGREIARVRHRGKEPDVFNANRPSIIDSTALVVLINDLSASASEIVAGALQDHDRALVVGTASFGKGLVQTLYPIEGGWAIKLTTGKWYTPSGRSIQGEHKTLEDGRFVEYEPDSLETDSLKKNRPVFRSTGGRIVYGGGGITPDVIVRPDTLNDPEQEFLRALGPRYSLLHTTAFGYARELKTRVQPDFTVPDAWLDELYQRLQKANVKVDRGLYDGAAPYIRRILEQRVATLAFGDSAWFRRIVPEDRQLLTALEYLRKGRTQRELLALASNNGVARPQ
ncbi:MAG TPA: S41 family peptidase [Gemmatimonadales bacterium]